MSNELSERAQALIDEARGREVVAAVVSLPALRYSPAAMVNLMVENPDFTHTQLAQAFGRTPSWLSGVLASDAFQQALDPHRHLIADPYLTATMEERFRALAMRSASVLMQKLDSKEVSDLTVLKAAEIGVKALGMGQKIIHETAAPIAEGPAQLSVAEKLLKAMDELDRKRTIDTKTVDITDG